MLEIRLSRIFEKSLKSLKKKHYDTSELKKVIEMLRIEQNIPSKYHDHALLGDLKGFRECHIERDILLVYEKTSKILSLANIGQHIDVFSKKNIKFYFD